MKTVFVGKFIFSDEKKPEKFVVYFTNVVSASDSIGTNVRIITRRDICIEVHISKRCSVNKKTTTNVDVHVST